MTIPTTSLGRARISGLLFWAKSEEAKKRRMNKGRNDINCVIKLLEA
jgi:hypothetical protein